MGQKNMILKNMGEGRGIVKGLLVSLILLVVLIPITALILTLKDINEHWLTIIAYVIIGLSSLIGGWVGGKALGKSGLKNGAMIGLVIAGVVTIAGVIMSGLEFSFLTPIKFAVCVICGSVGGVLGTNQALKRKYK